MTPERGVVFCNTHLTAKNGRPVVAEHGVDTWRVSRYLDSDRELAAVSAAVGPRGVLAEKIGGHTVGVIPGHRMQWFEGHPAVEGLAHPTTLATAEEALLGALADAGWPLGRDAGVGRLDLTVTLRFADPREGLAFLAALAHVDVPRVKPAVYGRPPETVYFLGERSSRMLARVYDKGVEANTARAGELIRLEDQRRFQKSRRMRVAEYAGPTSRVPEMFTRRFAPVAESAHGLHAATLPVLAERMTQLVRDGAMTVREAERLAGSLLLHGEDLLPERTRRRRRRELRHHGLVLADAFADPLEVDVGEALDAALAAWSDET